MNDIAGAAQMADDPLFRMILDRLQNIESRMMMSEQTASHSRSTLHQKVEKINESVIKIESRVEKVETSVAAQAPSWAEYAAMKHKAAGAGWLGQKAWQAGKWVLATVAAIYVVRGEIANWWHWIFGR